jgi:ABC-type sugar transport system ATPase subunit
MPELLKAEGISKHYGGVFALRSVNFTVNAGEVHALMGENGAGKSTLSKILAGAVRPDAGRIEVDGKPAMIRNPLDAQALGIGIIYQELDLFPHLSVAENIVIGNLNFAENRFVNFHKIDAFCRPYLDRVGFRGNARATASSLPIGQLQLIALARALSMRARVILMDEPTSSLTEDAARRLFEVIAGLKQTGVSIVYVSHKMDEIFQICDRATVLRDGETIGVENIRNTTPRALIRMMVGRDLQERATTNHSPDSGVLLSVSNLTTRKLRSVSFEVKRGEVLGIAGLVGAGRSALGAALFGTDHVRTGQIWLRGNLIKSRSPASAIASGIGLLPENRKLQGLMMQMSLLENGSMAVLKKIQRFGILRPRREASALEPIYRELALKCPSWSARVSTLSGGNQQKALLARWLLVDPDVLFLDEPTRGIDVGAKEDIYRIINRLAAMGKGVILVSSELPELLRCSGRILVLHEGRVTAVFETREATQEKIMVAAANASPAEAVP